MRGTLAVRAQSGSRAVGSGASGLFVAVVPTEYRKALERRADIATPARSGRGLVIGEAAPWLISRRS